MRERREAVTQFLQELQKRANIRLEAGHQRGGSHLGDGFPLVAQGTEPCAGVRDELRQRHPSHLCRIRGTDLIDPLNRLMQGVES